MKRKIYIISQSDRTRDHKEVKRVLEKNGLSSSIVNVGDDEHEKMISKIGHHVLLLEDSCQAPFFDLKKLLFTNRVDFLSFGRLDTEHINIAKGNLDIGFNKDLINKDLPFSSKNLDIPYPTYNLAIDMPPETIPHEYLKFYRSLYILSRNITRVFSTLDKRHKPVTICAPARPYNGSENSSFITEIKGFLGKRARLISDISKIEKGSTVLTWSSKRFFLLLSMGYRPVPLTKCLASSVLYSRKENLKNMVLKSYKNSTPDLLQALESTKLENNLGLIYKIIEN